MSFCTNKQPNTDAYVEQIIQTLNVPGDIAECGVYKGWNTKYYSQCLQDYRSHKVLYGFDSFCGFPADSQDSVDLHKFSDTDFNDVVHYLRDCQNVRLCRGYFEDTFPKYNDLKFSCVILDCDLYQSYKTCLNFFYPRMSCDGVMILDEYYSKKYPLARVAIDEFFKSTQEKPEIFKIENNGWERWRVVKG